VCDSESCPSRKLALAPLSKPLVDEGGKVWLVGAGPGDPDLLTVKALRLIQSAHVILHDDLVPRAILDLGRHAESINVGKRRGVKNITQEEINGLMINTRATVAAWCGSRAAIRSSLDAQRKRWPRSPMPLSRSK